tara:strand:- start:262 stop:504 length:243 start_codon:yes stop_codon:yes gene_type:complete
MFAYMKYYNAKKVALIYPGATIKKTHGHYYDHNEQSPQSLGLEECSVISLPHNTNIRDWQKEITFEIEKWIGLENYADHN